MLAHRQGLLARAVKNYADLFECDQAAADHLVELRQDALDSLSEFDNFDHDRQVLRQPEDFVGVVNARRTVSADAAENGCAAELLPAKQLDDGFLKRFTVPAVGFSNVNTHERAFALETLVLGMLFHNASVSAVL